MMDIPGFTVETLLGRGGMAEVYLAVQERLQRKVALKVLRHAADPSYTQRFIREARLCANLHHSGIVAIYDFGVEGELSYIAMEYLPGGELKSRLATPLPVVDALTITAQVASALAFAHAQGVLHRDIKPENIMFAGDGRVVLTDFGIARAISSDTHMTQVGMVIGTPAYMSPEQAMGEPLDARSDLYSLGVVLYEMLNGTVPYEAETPYAVGIKHITAPVPRLTRPEAVGYQVLVDRLLAKKPEARFQSADELLATLDGVLADMHAALRRSGPAAGIAGESRLGADSTYRVVSGQHQRQQGRTLVTGETALPDDDKTVVHQRSGERPIQPVPAPETPPPPVAGRPGFRLSPARWLLLSAVAAALAAGGGYYYRSRPAAAPELLMSETARQELDAIIASARSAMASGSLDKAADFLAAADFRAPGEPAVAELKSALGIAYARRAAGALERGAVGDAQGDMARAHALNPGARETAETLKRLETTLAAEQEREQARRQQALRLAEILQKARDREKAGQLVEPPNESAARYYLQVLMAEPGHGEALKGLERITAALLARAEALEGRGELAPAQQVLDQALAIQPREQGEARAALEQRRQRLGEKQAAATRELRAREALSATISRLVGEARELERSGALAGGGAETAAGKYQEILRLAPDEPTAKAALARIAETLGGRLRATLEPGNLSREALNQADGELETLRSVSGESAAVVELGGRLAAIRRELEAREQARRQQQAEIQTLREGFDRALERKLLLEPRSLSALSQYGKLAEKLPEAERQTLAARLIGELDGAFRQALNQDRLTEAEKLVAAMKGLGAGEQAGRADQALKARIVAMANEKNARQEQERQRRAEAEDERLRKAEAEFAQLIQAGRTALARGALLEPREDSAWHHFNEAAKRKPDATEARQGLNEVVKALRSALTAALAALRDRASTENLQRLDTAIADLARVAPGAAEIAPARRLLAETRDRLDDERRRSAEAARLALEREQALQADAARYARLAAPGATPAQLREAATLLASLAGRDAAGHGARKQQLLERYLALIENQIAAGETSPARAALAEARTLAGQDARLDALEERLTRSKKKTAVGVGF